MKTIELLKQMEKKLFHAAYQYYHYAKRYEDENASGSLEGIVKEIETMTEKRQPEGGRKDCLIHVDRDEMEQIKRVENELHRLQESIKQFDRIGSDLRKCENTLKRYWSAL